MKFLWPVYCTATGTAFGFRLREARFSAGGWRSLFFKCPNTKGVSKFF
jgi:hypothetical protein